MTDQLPDFADDEVAQRLNVEIEREGFETVGGYLLSRLGRVPAVGETFEVGEQRARNVHVHQGVSEDEFVKMRTARDARRTVVAAAINPR